MSKKKREILPIERLAGPVIPGSTLHRFLELIAKGIAQELQDKVDGPANDWPLPGNRKGPNPR